MENQAQINIVLQNNIKQFNNLPWHLPLKEWKENCKYIIDLPRGLSRHCVVFIKFNKTAYALKELPPNIAMEEFNLLKIFNSSKLPCVQPVGYADIINKNIHTSVLITRYLEHSLPYRSLFSNDQMIRYREHLLDAIASLMVQLHLSGIFWGDCSLSNTLFKRDAGFLQAYLVDAETSQIFTPPLPPNYRFDDLVIMEDNLVGDLSEIRFEYKLNSITPKEMGAYVRLQYQRLWEMINNDTEISVDDTYRIQERIRALNDLGFSVGEIELIESTGGDKVRMHVAVTDRNYHRNLLYDLTGLCTEEMQARTLMNEIVQLKATLTDTENHNLPLFHAAQYWLENNYMPIIERLGSYLSKDTDPAELYCQVLENKWYLSERENRDVGHKIATENFIHNHILKSKD